jgi:O-antigen ligase
LYTLLFSLSIILINPWGASRGFIWTQPKVFVVLLITLLNLAILWEEKENLTIPSSWKIFRTLWALFLGIGTISTLESPFPLRSLFGQEQMGDGLLYWLLVAGFTLSNTLLLRLHPELARSQLQGLLIGGIILALSIFPQVTDWRIDYTATTGQLRDKYILASTIFQHQQPVGLYSHRGHAGFVLAAVAVLSLVACRWKWISARYLATALALILPALLLTQTRAAIIAIMAGIFYLIGRKYCKQLIPLALISLLAAGIITGIRPTYNNIPLIRQIASGRIFLGEVSWRGISQRPLLGWGFDGFGTAYPYVRDPNWMPAVVRLGDFSFDYFDKDRQLKTKPLKTAKAHNLILDTTLSTGILGMLSYFTLLGYYIERSIKSPDRGAEAVAIVYLAFTFTWFECAQFTHLAWWSLSLRGVSNPDP